MLAIIQARMSSQRLPGKMMMNLAGRPMLAWVVESVTRAASVSRVVVATSDDASDDSLAAFCAAAGTACHRGPLDDVMERFALAARREGADAFVRITGDSPLMDAAIIDRAVALYRAGDADLVTNVLIRSFPVGQSVEVLRNETFQSVSRKVADPQEREHITRHYYAHPGAFRIVGFTSGRADSGIQLSVDTPEDFAAAARLIAQCGGAPGDWRTLAAMRAELA